MGDILSAMERSCRFPNVKFGYNVETRLSEFKRACLLKAEGKEIIDRIGWAVSSFEAAINDRNALAHGAARLIPDDRAVELLKFHPTKADIYNIVRFVYDLDTMEEKVRHFDHICRNIIGLSWLLAQSCDLMDGVDSNFVIELRDN